MLYINKYNGLYRNILTLPPVRMVFIFDTNSGQCLNSAILINKLDYFKETTIKIKQTFNLLDKIETWDQYENLKICSDLFPFHPSEIHN